MLSIKVVFTDGRVKTMRFTGNMSIAEACKDIREKTELGGADHALFRPPNDLKHRKGQWLQGNKTFHFYDIVSGEELHYRKRHRQMKVSLMDGQDKLVLVDESASIRDVCAEICEKLRLEKPYEEWSLTLGSTRSFLDPVLGLQEQGVSEKDRVWLKKKHFWTDDKIDKSSPMNLSLMFFQARFGITHGEHYVTEDEAISFCALQLQREHGPYDKGKHKASVVFKDITHCFEEKYQKKRKMHQAALKEWDTLGNMTELDAMYQYMKLARTLATYGVVMFAVGVVVPGKREKVPELVGVSKSEVMRMDYKTRAIKERWPYMMIKRWAATNDMFTLDFGQKRDQYYNCYTNNAGGLGLQIQGYLDIMLRLRKQEGKVTVVDDASTTTIEDIAIDAGTVFEYNTTMVIIGDSDDEDMDSGEVVGSDDDDPDPVPLNQRLLRPGAPGGGAGDFGEDPDNDPEPVPLHARKLRPGKGPGGAGDKGPKKVFVTDVATCIDAVSEMQQMIEIPLNPSKVVAMDPDKPRKAFQEGMARLPRELDEPSENAHNIADCLAGIIRAAREVAAKDDDISLLEAARRVAKETEELLQCTRDLDDDPEEVSLKKRLLHHKQALKGASTYAQGAVEGMLVDPSSEQLLLASAKQLADAVNRMASVATKASDAEEVEKLSVKMLQLAKAIPAQTLLMASVSSKQDQVAKLGEKSIAASRRLLDICEQVEIDESAMSRVARAVKQVESSSTQLIDATKASKSRSVQEHENVAEALRKVGESADAILESTGDKAALEQHSNTLADNLAALIAAGKQHAKLDQDTISLLTAAKGVSSAVEGLLATTRDAAEDTKNVGLAREMLKSAQTISSDVKSALAHEDSKTLPYAVTRHEARKTAAATTELCTKAREVLSSVEKSRQKELISIVAQAENATQRMVHTIADAEVEESRVEIQEAMVKSVKKYAKTFQQLTAVSRSCVPSIEKTSVKADLGKVTENVAERVRDLVSALQAIPDEGARAFAEVEKTLEKEAVKVDSAMLNAAVDNLVQEQPRMEAVERLQVALVDLQRSMAVMRKTDTSGLVAAGKELVQAFGEVADASIAVAAATSDAAEKQQVLQKARGMVPQLADLLSAAKSEVRGVAQEDDMSFMDAARNVSRSLRAIVGTDEAAAIKAANRRFLPDLSALLKAAKAAQDGNDEDANMSLLSAAKTVSNSLQDLMATCHETDLPIELVSQVKGLLSSVDMQLGDKGTSRTAGEATATAVSSVSDTITDLLEVAEAFEEGPEDCDTVAKRIAKLLRVLKKAPALPHKASLDELVAAAEAVAMAANRAVEVAAKVPKVARSHPDELAAPVQNLVPVVEALIEASNEMSAILPDSDAAADAVECVRTMCHNMSLISSHSRTAKSDSGADGHMNLAMVEVRRAARELVLLSEQATPGLQELDESARAVGEAARFGAKIDHEAPYAGLAGLEAASDHLGATLKKTLAVASDDPSSLGDASTDASQAAVQVVEAAQNYDAITRAVAIVQACEQLAQKMRDSNSPDELKPYAKALAADVGAVVTTMKEVSQGERSTEVKNAIKVAYADVKPAQQDMVDAVKGAKKSDTGVSQAADAADHLVQVLRNMVFASPDAARAEDLIAAGKTVAVQTKNAIQNSMAVAKRPKDHFVKGQLLMACQDVDQARSDLLATVRSMAPGRAELTAARQRVARQVGEMETAGIAAEIGLLNVSTAKTRTQAQEALVEAAQEIDSSIGVVVDAAKQKDMRECGTLSLPIADKVDHAAATSRELAATTSDESFQIVSLNSAKEVGQAALAFLDAALELNADVSNKTAQKSLVIARSLASENVAALSDALKTSAEGLARCDQAAELIEQHQRRLDGASSEEQSYSEAKENVIAAARAVGKSVQTVQRGARGNAPEIGSFCLDLAQSMEVFVEAVLDASSSVEQPALRERLISEARRTCEETAGLCRVARALAIAPGSEEHLTELSLAFKSVTVALGGSVSAIRDAAVGEKACRDAAVSVSKFMADLDSVVIFAETGHFQYGEGSADLVSLTSTFEKSAKASLSKGKVLGKAAGGQGELSEAAHDLVTALETLVGDGKALASAIGDYVEFSVQKEVLTGTKAALMSTQAVVVAASQGLAEELPSLVRDMGQQLVAIVKAVKAAAATAIETQEAIALAREVIDSARTNFDSLRGARAEDARDVVEATRLVTQAAGKVISAASSSSTKQMLAALDEATATVGDFLKKAKGAEKLAKGKETGLGEASVAVAECFIDLLDAVNERKRDDWEATERINSFGDLMGDAVAAVVDALKQLPGQTQLVEENSMGEEVVDTFEVALKSVSNEASRLASSEEGDVGQLLIKASSGVLAATKGMLKASLAAQTDLLARAKKNQRLNVFARDEAWAKGLCASVEDVTRFTSFLVSVTNRTAATEIGNISGAIDELAKAARQLSSGSQRLIASAKAKSESSSSGAVKISRAGAKVTAAIEALLEAGKHTSEIARQQSIKKQKEPYDFQQRIEKGELKAQLEIARLERELERAKTAAKVKADLADSWQQSGKIGKVSKIDQALSAKKKAQKKEDLNKKLQQDIAEGKRKAKGKIAKVAPATQKAQREKRTSIREEARRRRNTETVPQDDLSDDDLPVPPPPVDSDSDEDLPEVPAPPSDSDEE